MLLLLLKKWVCDRIDIAGLISNGCLSLWKLQLNTCFMYTLLVCVCVYMETVYDFSIQSSCVRDSIVLYAKRANVDPIGF